MYGALVALGYKPAEFEALCSARWTPSARSPDLVSRRWPRCGGDSDGAQATRRRRRAEPPAARERLIGPRARRVGARRGRGAAAAQLREFVGQRKIADNLAVYVQAARKRGDALDHVLLSGPPGLGKTTLAYLLAHEMGSEVRVTSGPALERKGDLAGILTSLARGDILFIDEIHRLLAGGRGEPLPGDGGLPHRARHRRRRGRARHPAPHRALHAGRRDHAHRAAELAAAVALRHRRAFSFYSPSELTAIVHRSARLLGIPIDDAGADEIGRRARGTPRIANRLLRRVRDFAEVRGDGRVTRDCGRLRARTAWRSTPLGLDAGDRKLLATIDQTLRRRPGRHRVAGRVAGRGSRHARVRLRAVPDPGGLPDPHAARPAGHNQGISTSSAAAAGTTLRRAGQSFLKPLGGSVR